MGATNTKIRNTTDILNEAVTNITNRVLTENSNTVSASQDINLECSDFIAAAAIEACSRQSNINHPNCKMCHGEKITQDMTININASSITDNSIANKIQKAIKADLVTEVKNVEGGPILTSSNTNIDNIKRIATSIHDNFDNETVNKNLREFTLKQSFSSKNMGVSDIHQNLVTTFIAKDIINNTTSNDATFNQTITDIDKIASTKTNILTDAFNGINGIFNTMFGFLTSVLGTLGMYIVMAIVAFMFIFYFFGCYIPPLMPLAMSMGICKNRQSQPIPYSPYPQPMPITYSQNPQDWVVQKNQNQGIFTPMALQRSNAVRNLLTPVSGQGI